MKEPRALFRRKKDRPIVHGHKVVADQPGPPEGAMGDEVGSEL
jgi:hypothetical protein